MGPPWIGSNLVSPSVPVTFSDMAWYDYRESCTARAGEGVLNEESGGGIVRVLSLFVPFLIRLLAFLGVISLYRVCLTPAGARLGFR